MTYVTKAKALKYLHCPSLVFLQQNWYVFAIQIGINWYLYPNVGLTKSEQRPALEGDLCSMSLTT